MSSLLLAAVPLAAAGANALQYQPLAADDAAALRHCGRLTVQRLRSLAGDSSASRILISACTDSALLSDLLAAVSRDAAPDSAVVLADCAVPQSLRSRCPLALHPLLQQLAADDLLVISARSLAAAPPETSVQALAVQSAQLVHWLPRPTAWQRLPDIGPGRELLPVNSLRARLQTLPQTAVADQLQRSCLEAGVLLQWNHLDASHAIAQSLEGRGTPRTADYWHALMHRREPDLGNAAWWFRSVGAHPACAVLHQQLDSWLCELGTPEPELQLIRSRLLCSQGWDHQALLTLYREALQHPGELQDRAARRVQSLEILNLLCSSLV